MRYPAIALVCLALAALSPACHARGYHSTHAYTTSGAALRTVPAGLPKWADAPSAYTLGTYHNARSGAMHGTSTLRQSHAHRLATCNPFANVTATRALAPCP